MQKFEKFEKFKIFLSCKLIKDEYLQIISMPILKMEAKSFACRVGMKFSIKLSVVLLILYFLDSAKSSSVFSGVTIITGLSEYSDTSSMHAQQISVNTPLMWESLQKIAVKSLQVYIIRLIIPQLFKLSKLSLIRLQNQGANMYNILFCCNSNFYSKKLFSFHFLMEGQSAFLV